eukprot:scaffold27079_cov32-Tisochrysis_lutea.AAC.2
MAGSSPWATILRLLMAPRASKWRRIGPVVDIGASIRRGTRRKSSPTAYSISTASPTSPLLAAVAIVCDTEPRCVRTTSTQAKAAFGCSERTVRERPSTPAWPGAHTEPKLDAWIPLVMIKSGTGRGSNCCLARSRAPSIDAKTPVPVGEPEMDSENIRLLAWRSKACLSIGDGAMEFNCPRPSTRAGTCTTSPEGLVCVSHCVTLEHAAFERVQPNHGVTWFANSRQPHPSKVCPLTLDDRAHAALGRRQSGLTDHEWQSRLSRRRLGKQPGQLKRPIKVCGVDLGTEPVGAAAQEGK